MGPFIRHVARFVANVANYTLRGVYVCDASPARGGIVEAHPARACENRVMLASQWQWLGAVAVGCCLRAGLGCGGDAFPGRWSPRRDDDCGSRLSPNCGGRGRATTICLPPVQAWITTPPMWQRRPSPAGASRPGHGDMRPLPGRQGAMGAMCLAVVSSLLALALLLSLAAPVAWAACPDASAWARTAVTPRPPLRRIALSPIEVLCAADVSKGAGNARTPLFPAPS